MIVPARGFDQKTQMEPFERIMDCRNASSVRSPKTIASTNGATG